VSEASELRSRSEGQARSARKAGIHFDFAWRWKGKIKMDPSVRWDDEKNEDG